MKYAHVLMPLIFLLPVMSQANQQQNKYSSYLELELGEEQHLKFMREEEKLARDVYTTFSSQYSDAKIFGQIDDSEQQHMDMIKILLDKYGIEDPSTNDNIGVFTGDEYGDYFTDKFALLIARGHESKLQAAYVGAFIEELDMIDIQQCNQVILDLNPGLEACGLAHTDRDDLERVLTNLLEGSKNHLRAYVSNIEKEIGEGNYIPQLLSEDELDEILGR